MRSVYIMFFMSLLTSFSWMCRPQNVAKTPVQSPSQKIILPNFNLTQLNRDRTVRVYLPPNYEQDASRFPVIYMHDAQNLFEDSTSYVGEWRVDEKLDSLYKTTGLRFIVVGIDHGNDKRINELSTYQNEKYGKAEGQAYLNFITKTLKPIIDKNYKTLTNSENTYMMGSSLGGLITHSALLQAQDVFGKFGILSPSYWFAGDKIYTDTERIVFQPETKAYILVGAKEGDSMEPDAQRMANLLRAQLPKKKIQFYTDPTGEHNEHFWRKHFARIVLWLHAS